MTIALVFLLLVGLVLINVPIAIAIAAVAMVGMAATHGTMALVNAMLTFYSGATGFPMLAIPLFVLAGGLMNTSGISRRLIAFVSALVGFVRGGLAMVNIVVSMIFAEISGSAVADVAALGSVLIPEMKRRGYKGPFAAAVSSSAASLAVIIPPSLPMILYGAIADTSITQLFIAGVVPGILCGLGMMALSYWYAVKFNLPREQAFSLARLWSSLREAAWALTLPVIILGGIFSGIVTATEAAGLAVLAALAVGIGVYRELDWRLLHKSLVDGVVQTAAVMLLVTASAVLGIYLTQLEVPTRLTRAMLAISENRYVVLAMLNVLFFGIGCIMHGAAAIVLIVPIVMPLVHQLGIDPVHFGIIVTLNVAIGQQTPPVASVLAVACSIAKEDMWAVTRVNLGYIGLLVTTLLVVTYVPWFSTGLVRALYAP
ncbi:MAG: TRAP transporter large permease [Casimicrobiaceae bacterium]